MSALGLYFLVGGLAVIAAIAALIWIVRRSGFTPKPSRALAPDSQGEGESLSTELETIRSEFRGAIEAARAASIRATSIGAKFIAALKPVDTALRDLINRIDALEVRSRAYDQTLDNFNSSIDKQSNSLNKASTDAERLGADQKQLEQQLLALVEQISSLNNETVKLVSDRTAKSDVRIEAINAQITEIRTTVDSLVTSVHFTEHGQGNLSAGVELNANQPSKLEYSIASLTERIKNLDRRVIELETLQSASLNGTREGSTSHGDMVTVSEESSTSSNPEELQPDHAIPREGSTSHGDMVTVSEESSTSSNPEESQSDHAIPREGDQCHETPVGKIDHAAG
jgi:chromosome segregation ATPase